MNYLEVASKVVRRCQDLELSSGAGSGGPIDSITRQLSTPEMSKLIKKLDYETRGEPNQIVRNRYNNVSDFLKEVLKRRSVVNEKRKIQMRAHTARQEMRETCECGALHPQGANFYVTAADGNKVIPLSGPYPTHAEAVAMVDEIKEAAVEVDPSSAFTAFGTTAMKNTYRKPGIFNQRIPIR
jgi:hypothetical protein